MIPAGIAVGLGRDPVGSNLTEEPGQALAAAVDEEARRIRPGPVHRRSGADDGRRRARIGGCQTERETVDLGGQE